MQSKDLDTAGLQFRKTHPLLAMRRKSSLTLVDLSSEEDVKLL